MNSEGDENRPDPQQLLEAIKREESQRKHGRLKIFLGMAAGVGKTYAMLESAQKLHKDGVDVVVALIDSHGREETKRLLDGLKVIPEKWIQYKETVFEEMDLDAILKLSPQVVLVDELAHSNLPSSRHPKRWQDVNEILENGINVYTTLNVQHIESLKEVIEGITGITIRETVPDSIIEMAASIELIDLTPEELLQRLKAGKVYFPEQSQIAAKNFFQEDRLTALREIVLRYAAKKIDHDLHGMLSTVQRTNGWKLHEHLLVAVGPTIHSQKLIRTTRRLAFTLDAPWVAVHVDDGQVLDEAESALLAKNLSLARDLGAEVVTTQDQDIADALERVARQKGITQIIIGRSAQKSIFGIYRNIVLVDKLARKCTDIDVHIIRQSKTNKNPKKSIVTPMFEADARLYVYAVILVGFFSAMSWLFLSFVDYQIVGLVFFLGLLTMSLFFTKGPMLTACGLFALAWYFLLFPHVQELGLGVKALDVQLSLYILTVLVTVFLTDRANRNKEIVLKREAWTRALYEIVHEISVAHSSDELFVFVKEHLGAILRGRCEILVKDPSKGLIFHHIPDLINDDKEKNAAIWVFENEQEAGWSTSTLPASQNLYLPLKGFHEIVGVLMYHPLTAGALLNVEEKNFLYTVCQQLANYIERSFVKEHQRQVDHLQQVEKTHQTILKMLSEGFRKPLVNIQEALQGLKEEEVIKDKRV